MAGTAAARLLDWDAAARLGGRLAGGPPIGRRAVLHEQFSELVGDAERLVTGFTGLTIDGPPTRPVVMSRAEWVERNLRGFERVIDPWAERILGARREGAFAGVRRKVLAAQVGGLLGYLGRKVLGQYDLFGQSGAEDQLYFVVPNLVEMERRFRLPPRDFRLWLSLHEVTHRVQFGSVPWLRGHVQGLVDEYLGSVDLDARKLVETLRRALDEARRNRQWRSMGILFLLMTPEQRGVFRRMQAVMSLLEGHANYVMDGVAPGHVRGAERMRRVVKQRRKRNPLVQRALGIELKVRQYDLGETFVAGAVERSGMTGFNRVWETPDHIPTLEEVVDPGAWVDRVVTG
ncbi:MAG TPA: zinc-dependent metalloprotease [Actinomycetota bacterium]|nr:zinc-dependent metalloprotease [Actinomycetota bacterium]